MSQIITQITPKWESEKVVWGIQSNSVIAGGGYFYSSILTKESVIANLQDRTGKELVESQTLGLESISAANSILETLFVERADRSSTERSSQIINILNLLTVEDKNIASSDAFDNAVLYRLSFGNVFSLLELPEFDDEDIVSVLKNVLGLERAAPEIPTDDCCECDEEEPTDEKVEDKPKQPRVGPPPTATGPSSCDAIPRSTGIPDMKNSLLICDLPPLEINAIVSQTYKDWEDKQLKENFTIRECANNQNKGDSKFVGSTIGPKKPPSSEPLLPSPELSPEDPEASRSPGTAGPCGDIDLIQSLPQAYQEVLNKYGMRGLIRKAAQCAGLDLPMIDIKEIMLMSFLKQLDCNMFLSFIEAVVELTGLDRGPNITEFWEIEKIASLLKDNIRTVVSNLPADQLDILLKTPEINLAPEYIGVDSSVSANASVTVKMPQQIEDIIDVIEKWEPRELISFFESQNLFDILLYAICDQDKSQILEQIVSILEQVNLDDIGSPSVSIDFDENITEVITTIGNLYDKLVKIIQMGLGLELPDLTLDIINFDNFQMVPLGELPELPTVNLDLTPTIDLLSGVSVGIANTIIESISEATLSLLKSTIKAVCESCEQGKLGDLDIGNLIGDSAKNSFSAARAQELKNEVVESLRGVLPTNVPFSQVTNSLESLIDEVSSVLKPGQAGGLLLGESPPSVTRALKSIIDGNTQYENISPALQSEEQINRMFSNIGMLVDKVMLTDRISTLTMQTSLSNPPKELLVGCDSPQEEYERSELKKRGIPEEEIDKQIDRSRARKKKKFSELADLLAKDELMEGVVPPDDCKISPSGQKSPSLSPKEPPINDYLLEKTVDVIYDGIYMSFNREADTFPEAITVSQKGDKSIEEDAKETPAQNPGDGTINVIQQAQSSSVKVIAPELKGYYKSFSEGDTLLRNQDTVFTFTIPNKTPLEDSSKMFTERLKTFEFENVNDLVSNNADTSFTITYDPKTTTDIDIERYSVRIESLGGTEGVISTYDSNEDAQVVEAVKVVRESFDNVNSFSPQADFDNFVMSAWKEGTDTPAPLADDTVSLDYSSIYKDLFINAGSEVATSDFFDRNLLSLVDFTPQLSQKQRDCGCTDPHLLDLETIKKEVIKEFEDSQCNSSQSSMGKINEASPLDAASVGGIISTIVRVYLIEFSLRSLFVLSKLPLNYEKSKNNIIDTLVQSYFTDLIINDLDNLDNKYSLDFQSQSVLYHNKIASDNGWQKTGDVRVVISNLVSQQLETVITRVLQILGVNFANTSLSQLFVDRWLPLFDLPSTPTESRFFNLTALNIVSPEAPIINASVSSVSNNSQRQVFDLEDGNLILERYIIKNDITEPEEAWNRGDVSVEQLKDILEGYAPEQQTMPLSDFYDGPISLGLRLTYIPPVPNESNPESPPNAPPPEYVINNKAYRLVEEEITPEFSVTQQTTSGPTTVNIPSRSVNRIINPIPLISVSVPISSNQTTVRGLLNTISTPASRRMLWNLYSPRLSKELIEKDEFKFMFRYCFPLERMVFLLMAYSSTYFTLNDRVNNLFLNTKEQLKSTFYTMLNVNDPTYESESMKRLGGNKGLAALAESNSVIPGIDLKGIIAQTPLLMLKGMAEISDPNIALAKKIHDTALIGDVDIPMPIASLLALPLNIIPFAPGPPITPTGIAYLATDAANALLSPKEKELRKEKILKDSGGKINLNEANNADNCPDPDIDEKEEGIATEPPRDEELCEELCEPLANEVWLNILSSQIKQYDRNLLRRFQECAKITVDGLYGLQTRDALEFYGPPNTPDAQYPRGGAFTIPDCADKPKDELPVCKPCYELANSVHANLIESPRREYNRDLMRDFQTCAEIVVDGFYGPQTEAALKFYGPANTPPKQYSTGSPFEEPNCRSPEPTES